MAAAKTCLCLKMQTSKCCYSGTNPLASLPTAIFDHSLCTDLAGINHPVELDFIPQSGHCIFPCNANCAGLRTESPLRENEHTVEMANFQNKLE